MRSRFSRSSALLFLFILCTLALPARADVSIQSLRGQFRPPNSSWVVARLKDPEDFLCLDHKTLGKALNISGRSDPIPFDAKTYLEEIRKLLPDDKKNYSNAQINLVETKSFGGQSWDTFKVIAPDGLRQELWARKLSPNQVVLFLYTGMGEAYEANRGDFEKILQQGAKL